MSNKLEAMTEANRLTHKILENCKKLILNSDKPIASSEVSKYAQFSLTRANVESAFKGLYGFPEVMCISVNDAVIHGLPSEDVIINKGDVVSLDFGLKVDGYCSDAAITFLNQNDISPSNKKQALIQDTKRALEEAISLIQRKFPECYLSDIAETIGIYSTRYGVVDSYGGHEIGEKVHEGNLFVANTIEALRYDAKLKEGQFITIEPMFTLGSPELVTDADGFTLKTKDGSLSAHFEYSLAVTKDGIIVLK